MKLVSPTSTLFQNQRLSLQVEIIFWEIISPPQLAVRLDCHAQLVVKLSVDVLPRKSAKEHLT